MAFKCDYYEAPEQTCLTAGWEVIAAEGMCGPCVMRHLRPHAGSKPHPNTMIGRG